MVLQLGCYSVFGLPGLKLNLTLKFSFVLGHCDMCDEWDSDQACNNYIHMQVSSYRNMLLCLEQNWFSYFHICRWACCKSVFKLMIFILKTGWIEGSTLRFVINIHVSLAWSNTRRLNHATFNPISVTQTYLNLKLSSNYWVIMVIVAKCGKMVLNGVMSFTDDYSWPTSRTGLVIVVI